MISGFKIDIVVTFSDVFDEAPKELETYLTGISRARLLKIGTFFLSFVNHKSEFQDVKEFLGMFFQKENNELANNIYAKLLKLKYEAQAELVIINPMVILEFFEFCFSISTEVDTKSSAETEVNIFKAILVINERTISRQRLAIDSVRNIDAELHFASLSIAHSFPYSEFLNYNLSEVLTGQMIKSIFLFEFLDSDTRTSFLLSEFLKYFDCADWKEFLQYMLPLAFAIIKPRKEGYLDIALNRDENFAKGVKFLDKLNLNDTSVLNNHDFKSIRSKPFYKVNDGVYRIIYGLFVIELIHKGVFFKLAEVNNSVCEEKKIKNLRSLYCDNFSEKYLLYRILNSIYHNKGIEFSGEEIRQFGCEAEPDYYIRHGNKIFLFESKDILINATIKTTFDYSLYEQEFKKKLYYEEKNGKIDKKAVLQLVNNIDNILNNKFSFDIKYKAHLVYIYPIIVLHDHQFNIAGLNVIVNHWFKIELHKLKEKGLNIERIKPVTIIEMNTIIFHQDLFRDKILKLDFVLDEYFRFITLDLKKKYKNPQHFEEYAKRTVITFALFLSNYVSDRKIRRVPKMLMDKGVSIM